ncbi:uncharacterized protein [Hemitrygon akajei]|uniref:uncharacterized protein isoform X3 n=1 Tax=Hemitrygon akajei TaxID=2704970 RepID=UPI003BF96567
MCFWSEKSSVSGNPRILLQNLHLLHQRKMLPGLLSSSSILCVLSSPFRRVYFIAEGARRNYGGSCHRTFLVQNTQWKVSSIRKVYVNHPTLPLNLERDVVIVLAAHLALIVSILLLGCRSLHVEKRVINDDVSIEELIVTVGLISCITVALIVLMGATITLFIRILLAKFP